MLVFIEIQILCNVQEHHGHRSIEVKISCNIFDVHAFNVAGNNPSRTHLSFSQLDPVTEICAHLKKMSNTTIFSCHWVEVIIKWPLSSDFRLWTFKKSLTTYCHQLIDDRSIPFRQFSKFCLPNRQLDVITRWCKLGFST